MAKQRGYPDRRGMGAQSDFLSETFIPSESHRSKQLRMARELVRTGLKPEDVAHMLSLPIDLVHRVLAETSDPPDVGAPTFWRDVGSDLDRRMEREPQRRDVGNPHRGLIGRLGDLRKIGYDG